MAPAGLPPGFRFHPTDEELVNYYLKRKIHGIKIELDIIPEIDLYKCEPWELAGVISLPFSAMQLLIFFLAQRNLFYRVEIQSGISWGRAIASTRTGSGRTERPELDTGNRPAKIGRSVARIERSE